MAVWGFVRENAEMAAKAGIDKKTGLPRTGLEEYLKVIFPNVTDWVHDKIFGVTKSGEISRRRPDYRSESLKLIIEFDGLQHFTNPENVYKDTEAVKFYANEGYNVVRLPYFIPLTNKNVKNIFGVDVDEELFPEGVPSLNVENKNTPAYFCWQGVIKMATIYLDFPEQYELELKSLKEEKNQFCSGWEELAFLHDTLTLNNNKQ